MSFPKIKSSIVKVIPLATLSLASSLVFAGGADFTFKNSTGADIDEVYISKHSSGSWGNDVMGSQAFVDGESINITFSHDDDVCDFDIKVKYHDGDEATWGGVDLCKYSKITLKWNSGTKETEAFGE